jgi:tetratricopeptide (TPR) repeat protein
MNVGEFIISSICSHLLFKTHNNIFFVKIIKIMKRYLAIITLLFIIAGCSGSEMTQVSTEVEVDKLDTEILKNKALDHFINGSIAESKGDYTSALKEFNQSLIYDTSSGIYYALAKNYYLINKLADALKFSRLSVKMDSTETEYKQLLADIFTQARQVDSAAIVLEKILAKDSSDVKTYYKLARLYEDSRPLEAIKIYNRLTSIIGPDWNVLLRVAELYEKLGYKDEAAESVQGLLDIDPSNIAIKKLAIDFYTRNGYNDKALVMLNEIIETMPDDLEAREKKAQIYINENNWEAASKEYKYILEQPNVPLEAKVAIGASYFAKSFTDSTAIPIAKELFESIDKDTSDWQVKLYLGAIALNEGNDSLAIENFKYVTENASWNVESWIRLGGLYFDNRRYEEAEKIMSEAIEHFPNEFAVNLILGLSLAQQTKTKESKSYLEKAVELNPKDVNALSALGFALAQLNENEKAAKYINQALTLDPNNVNLLGQLGLIYNNLNKMAESDSLYEAALEIDSQNALINNNFAYSLSERDLQLDRALEMIKIAITADSSNASYLDTYGWIFFKLKDYEKSYFYIKKSLDIDEKNAEVLEHLGDVLYMQGKTKQAVEYWKKALDLDSSNETLIKKIATGVI